MNGPIHVPPGAIILPETPGVIITTGGSGGGGIVSIGQGSGSLSLGGSTILVNNTVNPVGGGGNISIGQGGSLFLGDGSSGGTITILSPIPEPSSYALLLVGLTALFPMVRRRSS